MKNSVLIIFLLLLFNTSSNGQSANNSKVAPNSNLTISKFIAFRNYVASKAIYPLIKSSKYSGVVPVNNVDELPDTNIRYKILMDMSIGMKDIASKNEINDGLAEVARAINTHIAGGVAKDKLDIVVVVHGAALKSFYNQAMYKSQYNVDNPNATLFDELLSLNVKFIACGQSMGFQNISKDQLVPWIKIALSAQIPITTYQLKGFVYKKIVTE